MLFPPVAESVPEQMISHYIAEWYIYCDPWKTEVWGSK